MNGRVSVSLAALGLLSSLGCGGEAVLSADERGGMISVVLSLDTRGLEGTEHRIILDAALLHIVALRGLTPEGEELLLARDHLLYLEDRIRLPAPLGPDSLDLETMTAEVGPHPALDGDALLLLARLLETEASEPACPTEEAPDPDGEPVSKAPDPDGEPVNTAPDPDGEPVNTAPDPDGEPVREASGPAEEPSRDGSDASEPSDHRPPGDLLAKPICSKMDALPSASRGGSSERNGDRSAEMATASSDVEGSSGPSRAGGEEENNEPVATSLASGLAAAGDEPFTLRVGDLRFVPVELDLEAQRARLLIPIGRYLTLEMIEDVIRGEADEFAIPPRR